MYTCQNTTQNSLTIFCSILLSQWTNVRIANKMYSVGYEISEDRSAVVKIV